MSTNGMLGGNFGNGIVGVPGSGIAIVSSSWKLHSEPLIFASMALFHVRAMIRRSEGRPERPAHRLRFPW